MVKPTDLTPGQIIQLRALAGDGAGKTEAARVLGVSRNWIDGSAERLGIKAEIDKLFPGTGRGRSPKKKFEITADLIRDLEAYSRQEKASLHGAAAVAGVHLITLRKAASRDGLLKWLNRLFPAKPEFGGGGQHKEKGPDGLRNLKPEQIKAPLNVDMSSVYVRSAAMNWRKAG